MNLLETDRIKRELEATPENFQEIIESTNIGICITDEDGIYFTVNTAYLGIVKYTLSEVIGKSFLMVVPDPQQDQLQQMHDDFIEVQIEIFDTFTIKDKHGKLVKIDVDAGFSDKINNRPHKITFISPRE